MNELEKKELSVEPTTEQIEKIIQVTNSWNTTGITPPRLDAYTEFYIARDGGLIRSLNHMLKMKKELDALRSERLADA